MITSVDKSRRESGQITILAILVTVLCNTAVVFAAWRPAQGPLKTKWAKDVSPAKVHPEYPRPQMVRKHWMNLNGLWDYAITAKDQSKPTAFDGKILVPFPIESALSGVMKSIGEKKRLWYKRTFEVPQDYRIPKNYKDRKILLHFGAVDWQTEVYINSQSVGTHKGGYDPFTFDITDALKKSGEQEIVISVWDPIRAGSQPRGKQVKKGHGIWYTSTTGIWQTVWLEPVPAAYIESFTIVPDIDKNEVRIQINPKGIDPATHLSGKYGCSAAVLEGEKQIAFAGGQFFEGPFKLKIENPRLWSPDDPYLYNLRITLHQEGHIVETVTSYFGMRKVSLEKDGDGYNRIFLNNKPLFMFGPLDQGFWPDGLYTAPTDEALRYDIEVTKKLGFNTARKHVKVEPARWYYWCDKLGLLVWQDMPNPNGFIKPDDPDIKRDAESAAQFELELKNLIDAHTNSPSIIMWVIFNEGWGQYDTARLTDWLRDYDPTRLINSASGWADRRTGDVIDIHKYPGPVAPLNEPKRVSVLGEFGGLGLPVKGHTWQDEENWGYKSFQNPVQLTNEYLELIKNLRPLVATGLAAAIYTQTTDVEIEVNGLMTYDRQIIKMDSTKIAGTNKQMYLSMPKVKSILPTASDKPSQWSFTTSEPEENWYTEDYDHSKWNFGTSGFGSRDPWSVVKTEWNTPDIWLRKTFELTELDMKNPHLAIHHDEEAIVYINGTLVAELEDYSADYIWIPLDTKTRKLLRKGPNLIAIKCRNTESGQFIDAGLIDVIEQN